MRRNLTLKSKLLKLLTNQTLMIINDSSQNIGNYKIQMEMLAGCCHIFNLERKIKFLKGLVDKNNRIRRLSRVQFYWALKRYTGLIIKTQIRPRRICLQQQRQQPLISQILLLRRPQSQARYM